MPPEEISKSCTLALKWRLAKPRFPFSNGELQSEQERESLKTADPKHQLKPDCSLNKETNAVPLRNMPNSVCAFEALISTCWCTGCYLLTSEIVIIGLKTSSNMLTRRNSSDRNTKVWEGTRNGCTVSASVRMWRNGHRSRRCEVSILLRNFLKCWTSLCDVLSTGAVQWGVSWFCHCWWTDRFEQLPSVWS